MSAVYRAEVEENGYETIFRPDGTILAFITEPEDRTSYRDFRPLLDELNALRARLDPSNDCMCEECIYSAADRAERAEVLTRA